jgi:large subunit ribosomal protein LP0
MPSAARLVKKEKYAAKLVSYLTKYSRCFIVHADNVGSNQFMNIRASLRPGSVVLMGKNTMIKRAIRAHCDSSGDETWQPLLDVLVGNVGIVFTNGELQDIRGKIEGNKVPAPARVGAIAPCDVYIYAGGTGMGPESTNFFQVLNIATKINKGTVEILADHKVVTKDEKVSSSAAVLLAKLKMTPFEYGLVIKYVMDNGAIFVPDVLDITDSDLLKGFAVGVRQVASLSFGANFPTVASVPHSFINAYKAVLAIAVATDYSFSQAEQLKAYLADPSAFVSVVQADEGSTKSAEPSKAPEPEPEEEEEEDMGFDLFD